MFQAIKKILLEPEENSWKLSGTTATYKSSYKTAGYTLASNGKSITYAKATTAEGLATIKCAKSKSFTVSGKKITLKNSALNKKVLISGGYEFSFAFDYKKATITGSASGEGSDVFIYNRSDGNDIITDYAEEDKISIASGTIGTVKKSGFNVIFTVGSNKITVKSAASKTVTCIDKNGKMNLILGGYEDDTINGGKGNDTLQGGSGADVFLYANGDGKDRIVDYAEEDTIKITAGKIKSKTTSGSASNVLEDDNFITGNDLSALVKEKATDYSLVQTNLIQKNTRLPSVTYSSKK